MVVEEPLKELPTELVRWGLFFVFVFVFLFSFFVGSAFIGEQEGRAGAQAQLGRSQQLLLQVESRTAIFLGVWEVGSPEGGHVARAVPSHHTDLQ